MAKKPQPDAFRPSVSVLVKLGSIAVHVDEMLSPDGHSFDRTALEQLLIDPDVKAWLESMDKLAMIPKKRHPTAHGRRQA